MAVQTVNTQIDPTIAGYRDYGLEESKRLYQGDTPQYYPGQTYVDPSQQTQDALNAMQTRALQGSPLNSAAQNAALQTIQGGFLGGNPFFEGAFKPAAEAAQRSFMDSIGQINSSASSAGRYGSNAMGNLQNRAMDSYSNSLTNTAGQLAYQNYDNERSRQQAMIGAAPALANQDYYDIGKLYEAGQATEGYSEKALQDDINRYNYDQNLPQMKLDRFLQNVYGAPGGQITTQPLYRNTGAGILGGGMAGYQMFGPWGALLGGLLGGMG
jgi:hypothetical protein